MKRKSGVAESLPTDWAQLIRTMLPQPLTDQDGLVIGGETGEVVVRITEAEIAVAAFAVEWQGAHSPTVAPEGWKTFPITARPERVAQAIIKARARRLGTYRWCHECHEISPPEWMADSMCQSCAEKNGVVF